MIIEATREDFLKKDGRILGIDYGEKRVGLALSDLNWTIASPFKIVDSHGIFRNLFNIVDENMVSLIVVGKPVPLFCNTPGYQAERTQKFVKKLLSVRDIDVIFWDERLSTAASMKCTDDLSYQKRKMVKDKIAASFVLQGFLDYLTFGR
ncbi:MAG: Holliday junction resolvase RuvX [Holosporales bacterium]|jgi:putative Holliday junction resolvase|nr:Holliday junction resolvase RuvX [Holosporales bacterium]